jgi:hypothetical protein
MSKKLQAILSFIFGVCVLIVLLTIVIIQPVPITLSYIFGFFFVVVLLAIAFIKPEPSSFQYNVFRTVLALAGAGVVAVIPGFIEVKCGDWLRAGGALAVFVVLYFWNPASQGVDVKSPKRS